MEESMTAHVGIMECTKSMGREIQKGAWWDPVVDGGRVSSPGALTLTLFYGKGRTW
jgi:hypothetical protein